MPKKDKLYLSFILIAFLLTRIFFLLQPFEEIDGYAIPDDTYLSLKIAKNIADAKGMTYGDNPTNGFQPLYVFIMVPVYMFVKTDLITPVYTALIMLSCFSIMSAFLVYRLILMLFKNSESAFFASLVFVMTPVLIRNTTNGLETSMSFYFFLLIIFVLYKYFYIPFAEIPSKRFFIAGLLLGLSALARIDNLFLFIALSIWLFLKYGNEKFSARTAVKNGIILLSGFAVIYLPWLFISYLNTGMIYPVSGNAVRIQGLSHEVHGKEHYEYFIFVLYKSLRFLFLNYFILMLFSAGGFLLALKNNGIQTVGRILRKRHLPLVITSALMYAAYIFYIPAYWFFPRYQIFIAIPLLIILGFSVKEFLSYKFITKIYNPVFYFAVFLFLVLNISRPGFRDFYFGNIGAGGYYNIGKWVSVNFNEGTKLGSLQTGAFAYFAENIKVYNLDGVVNTDALDAIKSNSLMEYIKNNKIEYLLTWEVNYDFIKLKSNNFKETDLTHLFRTSGLRSWDYEWDLYKVNY
jgi:hypothetical protein